MVDNITISIPQDRNGSTPIQIQAELIEVSSKGHNLFYEFEVNSVIPFNIGIPTIANNFSEDLIISEPIDRRVSFWRIRRNGDNLVLKTYPNSYKMMLDKEFTR